MFSNFRSTLCSLTYVVVATRIKTLFACETWGIPGSHAGFPTLFQFESTRWVGSGIFSLRLIDFVSLLSFSQNCIGSVFTTRRSLVKLSLVRLYCQDFVRSKWFHEEDSVSEFSCSSGKSDVGRVKSKKKGGAHALTSAVADEALNPFLESAHNYLKFVSDGVLSRSTWKSDPVKGLDCFDYSSIFSLPKEQAAACFWRLFHSFSVRGGLLKISEFFMLESLWILLRMYVTLIWTRITLVLKYDIWCQFCLVVLSCAVNQGCW